MSRETTLRPLGLVTQPNKHGLPAGAMSRALNVCMRDPFVVSSLPDVRTFRADVISSSYTLRRLFPGATNVLAVGDNSGTWAARWVTTGASNAITMPSGYTLSVGTAQCQSAKMRDRQVMTTSLDPLVFDSEGDTTARMVGIAAPEFGQPSADITDAQALADQYATAYRAIIRRVHSDGYETISAPSQLLIIQNDSGVTMDPTMRVMFPHNAGIAAGDIVELYRARAVAIDTTPGDTLFLAVRYEVTSSDVSTESVDITDTALEASLAQELYTNPGQGKIAKAETPPAKSTDVAVFRGYAFYAMDTLPSTLSTRIPGAFGNLSTTPERTHGIGRRTVTGTATLGNPTITGVSDVTGIVAGQDATSTGAFGPAVTAKVVSIAGSDVTFDTNAIANGAVAISITDVIELNGTESAVSDFGYWNDLIDDNGGARVIVDNVPVWTTDAGGSTSMANVEGLGLIIQNTRVLAGTLTVRATNGQNYSPALPEIDETAENGTSDTRTNRYAWSLDQRPEAVPLTHYAFVGSGTIYRMTPTKDGMFMWCSDGLHRLSGDGGDWRTDPVDPNLILAGRNAVDVLGDKVYAYTNEGLVSVSDSGGVEYLSRGVVGDLLPGAVYADTWDTFLTCDELHHEAVLTFRSGNNSVSYVFNTLTKAFTTIDDDEWSCTAYSRALQSLVIGAVSSNPDILYFEADTSATRMPGADVRFQPIAAGEPMATKEFVDVDYLFEGFSSAATLVPTFDGTAYTSVTVPASTIESHGVVPVPRNAPAVGRRIAPGFTLSAGGTAQKWSLRAMSVRYENVSEEADR